MKVKNDHRSKFSNLSNWKEEARKKSGLQRDSNPWLVSLLNFWFRNTLLVKVGNPISDGIVFVFHLSGCVREL